MRRAISPWLVSMMLALSLVFSGAASADATADLKAKLLKAYDGMVEKGRFRIASEVTSGKKTYHNRVDVEWPASYHMRNDQSEFIILPGATYMNQGGQWMKLPMDMSKMIQAMTPEAMKQGFANLSNVKDLGAGDVNGQAAHIYEYDTSGEVMGIHAESRVKVWLSDADGLVLRQEVNGKAMGQASVTVSTYEYDASIRIKAPI